MDDKVLFSFNDIYGASICFIFSIFFLKIVSRYFIKDSGLFKLFLWGFLLKIIGVVCTVFYYSYIRSGEDSYVYFTVAKSISKAISQFSFNEYSKIYYLDFYDLPSKIKCLFPNENWLVLTFITNRFVIEVASVFSYFLFDSYLAVSFFFSLFGYLGIWLIFYTFYKKYPDLRDWFYWFIIVYPTILFWSTGIMKEPICFGSIGILFFLFFGQIKNFSTLIVFIVLGFISMVLLAGVKDYLLYAFVAGLFACFLVWCIKRINFRKYKYLLPLGLVMITGGVVYIFSNLQSLVYSSVAKHLVEHILILKTVQLEVGTTSYDLGKLDLTPFSLLTFIFSAINVCLFRPYIWETNLLQLIPATAEALLMTFMAIYILFKVDKINLLQLFKNNGILPFSLVFIIIVAAMAGGISFNFGVLSRYKTPLLPFYFALFFIIVKNNRIAMAKMLNQQNGSEV